MNDTVNTVFLRLEGPLQAWGDTSRFVIRRTMEAPTKSGILGLICCAMELSRQKARNLLGELNALAMSVRVDRPGTRWWDYHTVGAGVGLLTAEGKLKSGAPGTLITRREYLADASFLVALQGNEETIKKIAKALQAPKWPLFLGRKSCPPSVPVLLTRRRDDGTVEPDLRRFDDLESALMSVPWQPRLPLIDGKGPAGELIALLEWRTSYHQPHVPDDAEVWYDAPVSFDPPVHDPRLVIRKVIAVSSGEARQRSVPRPPRPRADYNDTEYNKRRNQRIEQDQGICVFCKSPAPPKGRATTVQHVTYRRAGGDELQEDLRTLCRLCHDACTMIEYGLGMGLDRINPEDARWRDAIIGKRNEIIRFRSLATRKRKLQPEEVE
jgi:CRISPR-associated protein Cas5/CasD subtype I-E